MIGPGESARSRPLRVFLGAFGDPGHAFPMLALGSELVRRGHDVIFETWRRWREHVEAAGMGFLPAPEYPVFPTRERPLQPYQAVVLATAETLPAVRAFAPDVLVHDILTLAPAMAGELEGVPIATLIPHLYPSSAPGAPPYALGARIPRTRVGRRLWLAAQHPVEAGLRKGRSELNETRARLGLPPVARLYGGLSDRLCIVAAFPQLEYPRRWPESVHIVGPLIWEPPAPTVALPPGEDPLVMVAPSTAQDPTHVLLRASVRGLAREPVRVIAATGHRPFPRPLRMPPNARLVEWISYGRTMPACSLVISHVGHGTLALALSSGCPLLAVPHSGDMGENAARLEWAGLGVRLPWRFVSPTTVRLAVRRALADASLATRADELSVWAAQHDGAARAAELVEQLAGAAV